MLKFSVKSDLREVERMFRDMQKKQVPFATALALTKTAKAIEKAEYEEIKKVFDRPTRYTLNSLYVRPAKKTRLSAEVMIKDFASNARPPIQWLIAQIEGGHRGMKGVERLLQRVGKMPPNMQLVPAQGMPKDAYGNVVRGELTRMISDLQAQPYDWTSNTSKASAGRRLRSRTRRAVFYFSTWPVGPQTAHLTPGIYRRSHFGFGTAIKPAMLFINSAQYKKRLDFYGIANRVGRSEWPRQFELAMAQALATAR